MRDLVIIGAGPAGLTAGLYASRAGLDAVLLERLSPGGQVVLTDKVENYPGFPGGISGFELVDRMRRQAEEFGLAIETREALALDLETAVKTLKTDEDQMEAKALILACGAVPRKLGIEGEELLTGKGVSYCATCDGPFYRDSEVAVIGGGDSAVEEALFLTRFASKVYLVHRRGELRAVKLLQDRAMANEKMEIVWHTVPSRILGEGKVEGIELANVKTGRTWRLDVEGVFFFVGYTPNTKLVEGILQLDDQGFVVTNSEMETSVPGVFAAGDIRSKQLRQISTAVGEGATACFAAQRYIEGLEKD